MKNKALILFSGGLDSGSLLFWALKNDYEVIPFFVNYGQNSFLGEWESVKKIIRLTNLQPIEPINVQNVAMLGREIDCVGLPCAESIEKYFPSRNLFLICLAAMYAYTKNINTIMIGLIQDTANTLPDCSEDFVNKVNTLLRIEYPQMDILAPFIARQKVEIVREAMNNGFIPGYSFCCNSFSDHHCWSCPSCLDRIRVFNDLGLQY